MFDGSKGSSTLRLRVPTSANADCRGKSSLGILLKYYPICYSVSEEPTERSLHPVPSRGFFWTKPIYLHPSSKKIMVTANQHFPLNSIQMPLVIPKPPQCQNGHTCATGNRQKTRDKHGFCFHRTITIGLMTDFFPLQAGDETHDLTGVGECVHNSTSPSNSSRN